MILPLAFVLLTFSSTHADLTYPSTVCLHGDVMTPYPRDPRQYMGNYQRISDNDPILQNLNPDIDTTYPIYSHRFFGGLISTVTRTQYLLKRKSIDGYSITNTLPSSSSTSFSTITLFTCYQSNLFDCTHNRWFWGNSYQYPIRPLQLNFGHCSNTFCINNLAITRNTVVQTLDGIYTQSTDPLTGNYKWTNNNNINLHWYWRNATISPGRTIYNWVLTKGDGDLVACVPGYAESPLYCTSFEHAKGNEELPWSTIGFADSTTFQLGTCDESSTTSNPTVSPTVPSNICTYNGTIYNTNDVVYVRQCAFGYTGTSDTATCQNDQLKWKIGCFKIAFSDDFRSFDDNIWTVYRNSISGITTMALDGSDSLRLIPEDPAYAGVLRSKYRIQYPMMVETTVEKRKKECNNVGLGIGKEWLVSKPHSARVSWGCAARQYNLFNKTFRWYDSVCWESDADDTMDMTMLLRKGDRNHLELTNTQSGCATLDLWVYDIINESLTWDDAYLWIGSYGKQEAFDYQQDLPNNATIIGRFQRIDYTRFYSQFNGFTDTIWDKQLSTVNESKGQAVLASKDKLVANKDVFQFTVPFRVKLQINRPDTYNSPINGVWAHYIAFGSTDYVANSTANVVQIAWDGHNRVRWLYTPKNIYWDGEDVQNEVDYSSYTDPICNWDQYDRSESVEIFFDAQKVTIVDGLCNGNITGYHNLPVETQFDTLSMGFMDGSVYDVNDRIVFQYIAAFQYPKSYRSTIADMNVVSEKYSMPDSEDDTSTKVPNDDTSTSADPDPDPELDSSSSQSIIVGVVVMFVMMYNHLYF